jgi:5-methylcytosine-specific restriction endonuclease McrA
VVAVCTKCGSNGPFYTNVSRPNGLSVWCADCNRADRRRYRMENREKDLACKRACAARWAKANKEEKARRAKADRTRHRERIRAQQAAWRRTHPLHEYLRSSTSQFKRKALLSAAPVTLTREHWIETLEVFGHRCAYCLRAGLPLAQDHVIAISRGGEHTQDNVVPACKSCNSKKGSRPVWSAAVA